MDTEQLLAFERVVREGSFSRAAWVLGIAQPTISARVQALERAVGGPLFVRGARGATLTDLGASFLPFARRALEVLEAGVDAARQAQAGRRGRVAIGALESLSGAFLGPVVAEFQRAEPEVEILVRAGRHEQLVELLLDGVVGLAIVVWPCADSIAADLKVLLQLRERVDLVAAPRHPLAAGEAQGEAEVAALARPFLLLRWWLSLPPPVTRIAQLSRPTVDVPMDTGRHMVLGGVGAGFFPAMQVSDLLAAGLLRAVPVAGLPPLARESALVQRAKTTLGPAALALAAAVERRARQLGLAVYGGQATA